MQNYGCALALAAVMEISCGQSWAQTPVDVSRFDVAGIKLRMPISDVAAVLKLRQQQEGGEILGRQELEGVLSDYHSSKKNLYFGYSTELYKIGVTMSPAYQIDGKLLPPSAIDVLFVIKNYEKDSGAREHVLEKYGTPTFENKITGEIKYCQQLVKDGNNNQMCDPNHGDMLFFVNGTLYLADKEFEEFTKAHIVP